MRVALFITCYNDLLFPEVGRATVRLLRRLGVEVEFPAGQTCCGQMHFNTGYRDDCIPLVERFVDAFEDYDADRHAVGLVRLDGPPLSPGRGGAGRRAGQGPGAAGPRRGGLAEGPTS